MVGLFVFFKKTFFRSMPPQRNSNNHRYSQKPYENNSDFKNLHISLYQFKHILENLSTTFFTIGNLPENCTEELLKEAMAKFGKVESVRVPLPGPSDKNHRGYGFVTYSDSKGAKAALEAKRVEVRGHAVIVAVAGLFCNFFVHPLFHSFCTNRETRH